MCLELTGSCFQFSATISMHTAPPPLWSSSGTLCGILHSCSLLTTQTLFTEYVSQSYSYLPNHWRPTGSNMNPPPLWPFILKVCSSYLACFFLLYSFMALNNFKCVSFVVSIILRICHKLMAVSSKFAFILSLDISSWCGYFPMGFSSWIEHVSSLFLFTVIKTFLCTY